MAVRRSRPSKRRKERRHMFSTLVRQVEPFLEPSRSLTVLKDPLLQQKMILEEAYAKNPYNLFCEESVYAPQLDDDDVDDFGGISETQSQFGGFEAENDAVGQELQKLPEAAENPLKRVQLFNQAADNCLNLTKPD